jgi:hypothetical protein
MARIEARPRREVTVGVRHWWKRGVNTFCLVTADVRSWWERGANTFFLMVVEDIASSPSTR